VLGYVSMIMTGPVPHQPSWSAEQTLRGADRCALVVREADPNVMTKLSPLVR
jgi:hypothetical protein